MEVLEGMKFLISLSGNVALSVAYYSDSLASFQTWEHSRCWVALVRLSLCKEITSVTSLF